MNAAGTVAPDPAQTLEAEVAGYRALLGHLGVEQAALLAADAGAVAAALVDKARQVEALRVAARTRCAALVAAGVAPDAAGMRQWLAAAPRAPQAAARWLELSRLAAAASAQNALNGRLIRTQQHHWDRALSALRHAAGITTTYGADGRTQPHSSPRMFAAI